MTALPFPENTLSSLQRYRMLKQRLVSDAPPQDSILHFLTDGSYGPFTGGSIRLADLDAEDEIRKFPREDHRAKLWYGAAVRHFLEGDYDRFCAIVNDPETPLTPEAQDKIESAIEGDDKGQHRYEVMLYDWEQLHEHEIGLEAQLRSVNADLARPIHSLSKDKLADRTKRLERIKYGQLRELLGINLAQGDMKMVREYVAQLKGFPMEQYEQKGHTMAMIHYLENGGLDFLEDRAKFGTKYWYQDKIGTASRPGSLRQLYRDCKKEARAAAAVNAIAFPLGAGTTYLGMRYKAEIIAAVQSLGVDSQALLQYLGK